jgi:hypothetical protein
MRQSLIFSRRNDNGVLTVEDMQQRAPAMFSDTKAERLTDRYAAFRTADLLPIMADYDYFPVQAAQKRPTKNSPTKAEHKTHMVAFSKGGDQGDGQTRGEIIVYNSHDGSSALRLFAGAYRFICSNGIVAGEGMQQRIYHTTKSSNPCALPSKLCLRCCSSSRLPVTSTSTACSSMSLPSKP